MPVKTRDRIDAVCAAAVDLARAAAIDEAGAPQLVGEHLGTDAEEERLVLHSFASAVPAYRGWHWAVVVTRASRAKVATVAEVTLLPGGDALLAPEWLPWSERVRPGDVGVGDLLPTAADDPRLDLRVGDVFELSDDRLFIELGLGRARVLSGYGRDVAADRWYEGTAGPAAPVAKAAPAPCSTCGFLVHLVGGLGQLFGVCGNEMSPEDGRVVSSDHGCGAHSEAMVLPEGMPASWAHPAASSQDDDESPADRAVSASSGEDAAETETETGVEPDAPADDDGASVTGTEGGEPYGHS